MQVSKIRSTEIRPIPKISSKTSINDYLSTMESNEYSLKQNFFDPSKSSPPNEFMSKLKQRMSVYDSYFTNFINIDSE
jgi:hypothetical protein